MSRSSFLKFLAAVVLVFGSSLVSRAVPAATAVDIPEYTQLLPKCSDPGATTVPCHWPDQSQSDSPVVVFVKCDAAASITNYCYDITVNGSPAPSTLGLVARMTAYKTHDASVSNAQYEAAFHLFAVPAGQTLSRMDYWGWGERPRDQSNGGGKVDLSSVLKPTDVVKIVAKFKMHKLPQYNVFISSNGTMNFSLAGNDLTITMEGSPAQVAVESAVQHINFDTEKNDDTSLPWTNRCGAPSMKFVVCNVDKAESNPLVFYARSSTLVNSPAGDVPGPIWVSTNATYFHFPNVTTDSSGNKQIQLKVAAPHFLADGTTVNSGAFRTFLPNDLLTLWKIPKTEDGLNKSLATSIKKAGKEEVLERTFVISDSGVTITFPSLTYSSPEVYVTSVATTGGSQNANQVYAALLAGASVNQSTPAATATTTASSSASKSLKKGSSTALTSLIKPASGMKAVWSVSGGCRIMNLKLAAITKGATCKLTLSQTNTTTKKTTKKYLNITVT